MIALIIQMLARVLIGQRSWAWRSSIGAAYFAHSIATPVTTLKVLLEGRSKATAPLQAVRHIERLIQDLVHPQKEVFSVTRCIKEIIALLGNQGVRLVNSVGQTSEQKDKIFGYRCRFQEAVVCIISNALQAYAYNQEPSVLVSIRVDTNVVVIYIVDFGKGMSRLQAVVAQLPSIRFRSEGSGLGLSFAKDVIESEYAGRLHIVSMIGVGTTVQITIPLRQS